MNSSINSRNKAIKLAAIAVSFVLLVSSALLLGYFRAGNAYADDNTYTTDSFYTHVTVNEDNSFDVSENITVDFYYPHHGIYRYIPQNGTSVSNVKIPDYEYDTYYENGNYVVQIGSGDYTLTGVNEYDINYRLTAWDDETEEKDVLMLNVIPSGWQTDIAKAKAVIELPKETDLSSLEVFSGSYGAEGNEDNAEVEVSDDGRTITVTAENLPVYHGITITADLPEGYYSGERVRGEITPGFIFSLLIGAVLCFLIWFLFGRDEKMVKTVEFYPPDDLTPGEIGFIIDQRADKCDIVSSIVYMANKGYLTIEEASKGDFVLTVKAPIDDNEPAYVKTIYKGLFAHKETVHTKNLDEKFGAKFERATDQLASEYYRKPVKNRKAAAVRLISALICTMPVAALGRWDNASGFDGTYTWAAGLLIFIAAIKACKIYDNIHSWKKSKLIRKAIVMGLFLCLAMAWIPGNDTSALSVVPTTTKWIIVVAVMGLTGLCIFLTVITEKTNSEYVRLMGRILGFKEFIATAELDKLKELVEEDPAYFYHITPYAYVFGLSDKWIKNFEDIPMTAPQWYAGSYRQMDMWDAYWMGRMMHDCSVSTANHIHIPVPESSGFSGGSGGHSSFSGGGFSGGGFSGGGMGGGGGGAW